jgi:hypothetical protein
MDLETISDSFQRQVIVFVSNPVEAAQNGHGKNLLMVFF